VCLGAKNRSFQGFHFPGNSLRLPRVSPPGTFGFNRSFDRFPITLGMGCPSIEKSLANGGKAGIFSSSGAFTPASWAFAPGFSANVRFRRANFTSTFCANLQDTLMVLHEPGWHLSCRDLAFLSTGTPINVTASS
jgi:hypothetical protein